MPTIDRDLARAINSGRCFAIIGSGPSCQMGVPSWKQLAEKAIGKARQTSKVSIVKECLEFFAQKNYPKVFSLVEKAIGQKELLDLVTASLVADKTHGRIYEYTIKWPFPCYLTTNFDDYLHQHLYSAEIPFAVRTNSREDMQALRADSTGLIVKIHGDPTVPQDIVLTEEQYDDFQNSDNREYWREKIRSALHMISFVIIGYSISDPDFKENLERAKDVASPNHPIFMFAADMRDDEIVKYYQNFNIRVIPYKNEDGKHQELLGLLRRYDPFIVKRTSPLLGLEPIDEEQAKLAASIHLFTRIRIIEDSKETCIEKTYASVILKILSDIPVNDKLDLDGLNSLLKKKTFAASTIDPTALQQALERLHSQGLIILSLDPTAVTLTQHGRAELAKVIAERDLIKEKFESSCRMFLEREYSQINTKSVNAIIKALQLGLVKAYEKRGMEIASSIFSDSEMDISGATDILGIINLASSNLQDDSQRAAFADLMIEIMLSPGKEMKEYLAVLSQGYFAFHALGLDSDCSKERLEMARKKTWILDSSILLPILAIDCENHNYAKDFLMRMSDLNLNFCTTERLFFEIRDHARWAISNFAHVSPDAPIFLQAAIAGPGFKSNLFLGGYLKWSLKQGAPSFHYYLAECLGAEYKEDLNGAIKSKIEELKIEIKDFSEWLGFAPESWPERDEIVKRISFLREQSKTYRSQEQCIAEAEVVIVAQTENAIFLSQSGFLNKFSRPKPKIVWHPEAMYRFLSLFSLTTTGIDLLFDCMIQDFYYGGFDIVDKQTISQYVSPVVKQARMELEKESAKYKEALGESKFAELKDDFERVPDEQKPFYSIQFAFYAANSAIKAAERTAEQERIEAERAVEAAESRMERAEKAKRLTEKEKKELERLKAKEAKRKKKAKKEQRRLKSQPKRKRRKKKKK